MSYLDLWDLPDDSTTFSITNKVENFFYRRCPPEKRPPALRARSKQDHEEETVDQEQQSGDSATESKTNAKSRNKKKVYDSSLPKALFYTFSYEWCMSGALKLISGASFTGLSNIF
jgi:ATP-binding cassette subfamily C (CFTR/MRP) protein 1